jgi:hypothetical protein
MLAPFPTGDGAGVHDQPLGKVLLGKAVPPPGGDYFLAKALRLIILGRVAQELDDPWDEAKGRG